MIIKVLYIDIGYIDIYQKIFLQLILRDFLFIMQTFSSEENELEIKRYSFNYNSFIYINRIFKKNIKP